MICAYTLSGWKRNRWPRGSWLDPFLLLPLSLVVLCTGHPFLLLFIFFRPWHDPNLQARGKRMLSSTLNSIAEVIKVCAHWNPADISAADLVPARPLGCKWPDLKWIKTVFACECEETAWSEHGFFSIWKQISGAVFPSQPNTITFSVVDSSSSLTSLLKTRLYTFYGFFLSCLSLAVNWRTTRE